MSLILNPFRHGASLVPDYTTRIALPLTYDESDYNALRTWTRSGGGGPHITPQGFRGNGYDSRYVTSGSIPAWLSSSSADLLIHASITLRPHPTGNGSGRTGADECVFVGPNSDSGPKLSLCVTRDSGVTSIPALDIRTSSATGRQLCRHGWKYEGQFPLLTSGGFEARPQAMLFLDADTYLVSAHYEDTFSRCYKIRVNDGVVLGYFDFPSPYLHIASAAMREDGTVWFSDYSTHKVLRVDIAASITAGTAQIDGVYGTSVVTGTGAIEWARLGASNAEYLILHDYVTSGTAYLYLIPAATVVLGNTFAVTDRYKRFVSEHRCQGISFYSGKAYSTHNRLIADASGNLGKMLRSDLSAQTDSLADNGTLVYEATTYCPSGLPQDLDFHPTTGWCWTPTEGYQSVGDVSGWLGIWSGPNDGTDVENHVSLFYDHSATTIYARLNNKTFASYNNSNSVTVAAVAIGGVPGVAASLTSGFTTAIVRNVVIADPSSWWSDAAYRTAVDGYYEPNALTVYTVTITNPGAESGTTGWTNETGTLATRSSNPAPHGGSNYFSGGSNAATKARQRFNIATVTGLTTGQIDAGGIWARATWWQTDFGGSDTDTVAVGLRTLDGTPTQITESVANKMNTGPDQVWVKRGHSLAIASGARNLDLLYDATRSAGTNLDGYVDDMELVIYRQ